jgi:hypothetical protein
MSDEEAEALAAAAFEKVDRFVSDTPLPEEVEEFARRKDDKPCTTG